MHTEFFSRYFAKNSTEKEIFMNDANYVIDFKGILYFIYDVYVNERFVLRFLILFVITKIWNLAFCRLKFCI